MKLSKIFKNKKNISSESIHKSIDIDPFFYWKKILLLILITLILVTICSVSVYYLVNTGKFVDSKTRQYVKELEVNKLNIEDLNKINEFFIERENMRNNIIQDESIIPDPSINPGTVIPQKEAGGVPVQKLNL